MKHVCILGGGRVGSAIAFDLSNENNFNVTVMDKEKNKVNRLKRLFHVNAETVDLSNSRTLSKVVREFDLIINALPGKIGYKTLKTLLETGKPTCDVSFFPENPFTLDDLAKKKRVPAVVDCGVAPGLSNIVVGHAATQMETIEDVKILVGGLPKNPDNITGYKAPFSPTDVIEEYLRPVRCIRDSKVVTLPALSEFETVTIPGIGELEAFNTDGLRTLIHTIKCRNMVEKTLRYPGHAEKMFFLKETGFLGEKPIQVGDTLVKPRDVTVSLLFPLWQFKEGEKDFTVMQITVKGLQEGEKTCFKFSLFDETDPETGLLSMARTTGFTVSLITQLVSKNLMKETGVIPPEQLGMKKEFYNFIINGLISRGIKIKSENKQY
ncbi:MAG TPA: saccharopine dehydrogenase [Thermoplasmatales archaeon]|nr:saccharopine dehydrogenase [Thermoplasmatales archaeon]